MAIKLDIEVGDEILTGRFKNKRIKVKEIGKDEYGTPTINGRPILKFRVAKWFETQPNIFDGKENKMTKKQLRQIIREEIQKINESSVPSGFSRFFKDKLKKTGWYGSDSEIKSEVKHTISNMKYDMKNGMSLMGAFQNAVRDLHIDPDGIESYI